MAKPFDYTPPPTLREFMLSDKLCRFTIGPLGSAKTTAMIMEMLRRSVQQEPDSDGVRPTRWAIIRNTLPQLKQTVLPDIKQLLDPLGIRHRVQDNSVMLNFRLDDKTRVQSEWLLIPIETTEDTRRLLSLQLTGAWVAEFREIDYAIVAALLGRVGRYPSPARVKPSWQGLFGESNPFSEGSDWYKHLVLDLPEGWVLFRQPSGLSDEAENRENLPDNYYERLMEGHSDEWIKVHVHGEYGDDMSGQAVFGKQFSRDFHVAENLQPISELPLMIAMDFGRTPAALICQVDPRSRLVVLREVTGEGMGVETFADEMLKPVLHQHYPGMRCFVVGDPSGAWKSQVSEISVFDALSSAGFHAEAAPTNEIGPRLRAVENILAKQVDGKGMLLIDQDNCPLLIKALAHFYRYRRKKTGDIEDKPDKNHPWSDLADALQYAACSMSMPRVGKIMGYRKQWRPKQPTVSARGWT